MPAEARKHIMLRMDGEGGLIVYVLQSITRPGQSYIGLTDDVVRRLAGHNAGRSPHTAKFKPWRLLVAVHFTDVAAAARFEQYVKSGSGRSFLKRHFWPNTPGPHF